MLGACPVCRQTDWRGRGRGAISVQPSLVGGLSSPRHSVWEDDEEDADETVCLHLVYVALCGQSLRPTKVLRLLAVSWLQGLAVMAIAYGDLTSAADTNTVAVLCAGEIMAAACAFVALMC